MLLYLTYCKPVIIAEGAATTAYDHSCGLSSFLKLPEGETR